MFTSLQIPGLDSEPDEQFREAVEVVVQYDRASASLLQRRLSVGYARAARIIDQLEAAGVLGPAEGSVPRTVLIKSTEEFFGKERELPQNEEQTSETYKDYQVPKKLKLSPREKTWWGKSFADVINTQAFKVLKSEFPLLLGFDQKDKLCSESLLDVGNMLLLGGNPLGQKENLLDTFLTTFLLNYSPLQLKMILIDPTHYLNLYSGIPHLLSPVISDFSKRVSAYHWSVAEVERRMKQFTEKGVRDIDAFNEKMGFEALPRILVVSFIIGGDIETEDFLTMLTRTGVRAGVHNLIVVDMGQEKTLLKSLNWNVPARAVFRVGSSAESKATTMQGAEKLERGEFLYKSAYGEPMKLNQIFTSIDNVNEVVNAVKTAGSGSI